MRVARRSVKMLLTVCVLTAVPALLCVCMCALGHCGTHALPPIRRRWRNWLAPRSIGVRKHPPPVVLARCLASANQVVSVTVTPPDDIADACGIIESAEPFACVLAVVANLRSGRT